MEMEVVRPKQRLAFIQRVQVNSERQRCIDLLPLCADKIAEEANSFDATCGDLGLEQCCCEIPRDTQRGHSAQATRLVVEVTA